MKLSNKIANKIKYLLKQAFFGFIDFELLFRKPKNTGEKKLLIIRVDAIGDFIIFSPLLKYYKKRYNGYCVTLLVNKISEPLAIRFKANEIWTFERRKFEKNFFYRRKLLLRLKRDKFDIAICPHFSRTSTVDYLMKRISADEKIGFDGDCSNIKPIQKKKNDGYYTKLIKISDEIISEVDKNKAFFEALGDIKADDYIPKIEVSDKDRKCAETILGQNNFKNKKFAVICLGVGSAFRMWPLERYAVLIEWLKKEKNIEAVICGAEEEKHLAERLKITVVSPVIDLVGRTDLSELIGIIKKAVLYVGVDTGPGHLAAAIGTPAVCIVGGGHPGRFFPWGDLSKNRIVTRQMPCFGCDWKCKYDSAICVHDISVQQVKDEIEKLISIAI